jgi:hypothetical protein
MESQRWPRAAAFTGLAVSILLGACASKISVRSDQDPNADFSRYSTWNFFDELGIEGGYNSPVFGELFREAIFEEMSARGYRLSTSPELRVNVSIRTDEKVKVTTQTAPYMSGAYYRGLYGPYHGSAFGVGVGTVSRATEVTEASVFIDLVDRSNDRLVWQGVAVAEANEKTAQNLREAIFTAVDRVFELYPHVAAQ